MRPRPPQLTSIPSLLSVFQNEWDALALESFQLQQELQKTRQELSTALYQNDAAVRVIVRLTRERDEARSALAKVGVSGVGAGDEMAVDNVGLSEELQQKVAATHEKLSKTRRKRPVPEDWATEEAIQGFEPESLDADAAKGAKTLAVDVSGDLILFGGQDGSAQAYSVEQEKPLHVFAGDGGAVTDVVWSGARAVIASATGAVRVYADGDEIEKFEQHAGAAVAVAMHPGGDILGSVGEDKSIIFYDITGSKVATQIFTDSSMIEPNFEVSKLTTQ